MNDNSYNIIKRKTTIYFKTFYFEISFLKISGVYVKNRFSFQENSFKEGDRVNVATKSSTKNASSEYTIFSSDISKQAEITYGSSLDLSQFGTDGIIITFEKI